MFSLYYRVLNATKKYKLRTNSLEFRNTFEESKTVPRILLRVLACMFVIKSVNMVTYYRGLYKKYNYLHLPAELIETQLYKERSQKLVPAKTNPDCKYDEILSSTSSLSPWEVPNKFDHFSTKGLVNGSYVPEHCNPVFSVAIIVPYRNRQSQLDIFLPYMHNFLRKQNIHYRIYVVEQQDARPFNRALLMNIGAKTAIEDKFPCLIFHDVDLLPLDAANLYACANSPRHMSASIDKFGFVLPYKDVAGGVLAIKSEDFIAVNGYSNRFNGWGGEDDDFFFRLKVHRLKVVRYPQQMSRYMMAEHRQEQRNGARRHILRENRQHSAGSARDGLSSLSRLTHQHTKTYSLLTVLGVQLRGRNTGASHRNRY